MATFMHILLADSGPGGLASLLHLLVVGFPRGLTSKQANQCDQARVLTIATTLECQFQPVRPDITLSLLACVAHGGAVESRLQVLSIEDPLKNLRKQLESQVYTRRRADASGAGKGTDSQ